MSEHHGLQPVDSNAVYTDRTCTTNKQIASHVPWPFHTRLSSTLPAALLEMAGVATCGGFSLPAPSATTLFQSPVNASEAVVLTPNCSATVRGVVSEEGDTVLHVDTLGIEVVDSFPSVYRL